MALNEDERVVVGALQGGLPLVPRPFEALAEGAGLGEEALIERTRGLLAEGAIARFGVIVRHRELGWRANAMVVWDVPDDDVDRAGELLARCSDVTLCYRRPRRRPHWPYNLFCMVHGRDRAAVRDRIEAVRHEAGLGRSPYAVLFSTRRFRQRGACYVHRNDDEADG